MPRMLLAQKYWRFWRGAAMHWEPQLKKYVFYLFDFPEFWGLKYLKQFRTLALQLEPIL